MKHKVGGSCSSLETVKEVLREKVWGLRLGQAALAFSAAGWGPAEGWS